MKNLNPWIIPLIVAFFSVQAVFAMCFEVSRLRFQLEICEKSKSIANEQIDELMYIVSNLRTEKENVSTQSFVAGVVEAIKDKNHYDAIWHDGYNRGGAVLQYASEIKPISNSDVKKSHP